MTNTNLIELDKNGADNNEILRFLVPGIQAKDYKVGYLNFGNLLTFLVAKSLNESLCCTLFDYEKIFDGYKKSVKLDSNLEYFSEGKTDCQFDTAKNAAAECIINLLMDSYVNNGIVLDQNQLVPLINNAVAYTSIGYNTIISDKLYPLLKDKSILSLDYGHADYWISLVSGITLTDPDEDNLADIEATINRWFKVLFQHLASVLPGELVKALLPKLAVNPENPTNPNAGPSAPATAPVQNQQVTVQMPVMNTDLNANKSKIDLVGWQDLQPGILSTDGNDQLPQQQMGVPFSSEATDYEHLNQQEKTIVDGLVQNMQHIEEMKNNPHAFEDEINAAKEALRQATEGIFNHQQPVAPQINIQPTTSNDNHTCNCGHKHCSCGGHH